MSITFIIGQDLLNEATTNTTEPFKGLFITKLPSEGVEYGYEVIDHQVILKYETDEDDCLRFNESTITGENLPSTYGVILKLHQASVLEVGAQKYNADVIVNAPDGTYKSIFNDEGLVENHPVEGDVFIKVEGFGYMAVLDHVICDLYRQYVCLDRGVFIPNEFMIRFTKPRGAFIYTPMSYLYSEPLVAESFYATVPSHRWEERRDFFDIHFGQPLGVTL